jgi:hypothetical protein
MFEPGRPLNSEHEDTPGLALLNQLLAPGRRELIEASPALAGALDPPPTDGALRFESIQDWIQGRHVERDGPVRSLRDARRDVVAMPRLVFELGEHQQFGRALLERVLFWWWSLYVVVRDI